jgi:hypothetical protein
VTSVRKSGIRSIIIIVGGDVIETIITNDGSSVRAAISVTSVRGSGIIMVVIIRVEGDVIDTIINVGSSVGVLLM